MLDSYHRPLCNVSLPFQGRQRYMHTFDLADPVMEDGFEDYLEPVQALIAAAGVTHGIGYLTVDEKIVEAGQSQRAPRPHVDGCVIPERIATGNAWGGGSAWGGGGGGGAWASGKVKRMPIIVASSVAGCKVWTGKFEAEPTEKGDLSHIADQLGEGTIVPAYQGALLSPDCIHESMVFDRRVERTFLRIALPVDFVVR